MLFDALFFGPWSLLILLPGILLGIYAQAKVSSTFHRYSKVFSSNHIVANLMAREMLNKQGYYEVGITETKGQLTDHYNPKTDIVALSSSVFSSTSIAALGVAAHEIGHVQQQKEGYFPMKMRSFLVPVVNFGSRMFLPLVVIGLLLEAFAIVSPKVSNVIINLSIIFYGLSTIFALITIPVELNASKRAKENLVSMGFLTESESVGVKRVLNAAAMTYFASFLTSLLYFLRFLLIIAQFRRRD